MPQSTKEDPPPQALSLSLLKRFMERLPVGLAIKDESLRYVYVNRYLRELFRVQEWIGRNALEIYPEEVGTALFAGDSRALRGESLESDLTMDDGTSARRRFRVAQFPVPLREDVNLVGSLLGDMTAFEEANERLSAELEAKDALLKEVYHRMKNNLATVASLLSLEAASVRDERALAAFDACQSRIQAMALVHESLYGSGDLSRIDVGPYLVKIAERLVPSSDDSLRVRLEIEAESALLDPAVAIPLGLVANELVTNAFKHAFPGGRRGLIKVRLIRAGSTLEFSVSDDGAGLPPGLDPREARSLGLQLVRGLARQAGGAADFPPTDQGFCCRITLPLAEG